MKTICPTFKSASFYIDIVKENHIGSAVTEIVQYKQTYTHIEMMLLFYYHIVNPSR